LVAGRIAEQRFWAHGALAAIFLNLIGTVIADALGQADGHLWLDLGFAACVGLIGGIWGPWLNV
jgi:hypothetical protein